MSSLIRSIRDAKHAMAMQLRQSCTSKLAFHASNAGKRGQVRSTLLHHLHTGTRGSKLITTSRPTHVLGCTLHQPSCACHCLAFLPLSQPTEAVPAHSLAHALLSDTPTQPPAHAHRVLAHTNPTQNTTPPHRHTDDTASNTPLSSTRLPDAAGQV